MQAVTKNFSTLVFLIAAFIALLLSFIQKIGAGETVKKKTSVKKNCLFLLLSTVILTIPQGVFGGLSIVLFGLVACSGARIWVENRVDFKDSRMMVIAGVPSKLSGLRLFKRKSKLRTFNFAVIIGAGMHTTLRWGSFELDAIGFSTYTAIILNQVLRQWNGFSLFDRSKKSQTTAKASDTSSPVAATVVV